MSAPELFTITLHHLAPDAKQAGRAFPDVERTKVDSAGLQALIEAIAALAPACDYTTAPELRITTETRGKFIVQVKNGQVKVTSWSVKAAAATLTPDEIFALVTGTEAPVEKQELVTHSTPAAGRPARQKMPRRNAVILLVVGIVTANALTAWMALRPPPGLPAEILPAYRVLDPDYGRRVLADYAGIYETGGNPGDRELTLFNDGRIKWVTFGPGRTAADVLMLTVQPAESRGKSVLVANNGGMVEMKDALSVVYFGDTYRRKL
jgi:hypothetical protein